MRRSADYVILGAGIAGMTLRHVLRDSSVALLDGAPGRYKIGESIIPQHFAEPEVRPLFAIARELPSASPKDGTLFIDDRSIGGFELLDSNLTLHVARPELEAATAAYFGTEIVRERVESVDAASRTVTTDAGTWVADRLVIDCSGPARLVARSLGVAREVWPVFASWAYHDILAIDDAALFGPVLRGEKAFFRYSEGLRRAEPSDDWKGIHPSRCTTLTQVEEGVWTWQIPLYGATRLSVGVVSRSGPVDEARYLEIVARSVAPSYRTRLRRWDGSGPHNAFHVRNHFAWAADRFAGDGWALVGDAAFFGDPVYSVGTGFATNHAIQLGRALREHGWSAGLAESHDRLTRDLYARTKRAYDAWYFGKVVHDAPTAADIQDDFLRGGAFQVRTLHAYSEMWLVSHPQDAWRSDDPGRGEDVTLPARARLVEPEPLLAGWALASASWFRGRLALRWQRPDAPEFLVELERVVAGRSYHRAARGIGLRFGGDGAAPPGGQERALVEAVMARAPALGQEWAELAPSEEEPVDGVEDGLRSLLGTAEIRGWQLTRASVTGVVLDAEWRRPGGTPLRLVLAPRTEGVPAYRTFAGFVLRYRRPEDGRADIDGEERAFVDAFAAVIERVASKVPALLAPGGPATSSPREAAAASPASMPRANAGRESRRAPLRIGIVGGGTAGYLTALALRRRQPACQVTLLESSRIPVIGVGEATTPDLVRFLHETLAIPEADLHREVRPTWKLGIRFLWGVPGGCFHHPFTGPYLPEAAAHARAPDLQSLGAQLMARDRAPILRDGVDAVRSLLPDVAHAYHLDNARFVAFLQRRAEAAGVERVDCVVQTATRGLDGNVADLRTDDDRVFSFDLYVDATGFRSLLLEKTLGQPFRSFASSLPTDAAVVADVAGHGELAPYTLAETMDAGWCWSIPQEDANHRGYVFATSHLTADAAEAEMRAKNPGMGPARLVRFRSGRLERCWVGNVVGLGNAYAFVEPLESTALHMVVHQIEALCDALAGSVDDRARDAMNDAVSAHWDTLRGFLALHYRFNRRLPTRFWKACEDIELGAGEAMLAEYRRGAPLVARPDRERLEDSLFGKGFFGLLGVDNVLLGQRVPTRMLVPRPERVAAFESWLREVAEPLSRALPQREALEAYRARLLA
ncbi:MAG TPA: FAD-dependent oxidoreductase [Polyangiaceae bacterium]|jgi:tryptophan halogenase